MTQRSTEQLMFDQAVQSPAPWFATAHNLKWSADQLCWLNESHQPIEDENHAARIFAIPMYRMLMGLSFENLFKGLLIAHGYEAVENGKLKEAFTKHNIRNLLSLLDTSHINLIPEERDILLELERYVVWQGRYPIPKNPDKYVMGNYRNHDHRIEQELWFRLSENLQDVGWKLDMHGNRLPLTGN